MQVANALLGFLSTNLGKSVIRVREFLPQTDTDTNAFANRTVHERLAAPPRLANKQRTTFTNIERTVHERVRGQGIFV